MPTDMERVQIVLDHVGWSRTRLAKQLGVSLTALRDWDSGGIPSARLPAVADVLGVAEQWITRGIDPPPWHWKNVLLTKDSGIDWRAIPLGDLLIEWWDRLEGALLDGLIADDCELTILRIVRVARWRFCGDRRGALLDQLGPGNIERLARDLHVWPVNAGFETILKAELEKHKPLRLPEALAQRTSAEQPTAWAPFQRELEVAVHRWRKASRDPPRRLRAQAEVHRLLTEPQLDEPLLTGMAVVPVLQSCVRAARATEILGGMTGQLQTAVEMILRSSPSTKILDDETVQQRTAVEAFLRGELNGEPFSLSDIGRLLQRRRGVVYADRTVGSRKDRRSTRHNLYDRTVSEDALLAILREIEQAYTAHKSQKRPAPHPIPLEKESGGRTWRLGSKRQKRKKP